MMTGLPSMIVREPSQSPLGDNADGNLWVRKCAYENLFGHGFHIQCYLLCLCWLVGVCSTANSTIDIY